MPSIPPVDGPCEAIGPLTSRLRSCPEVVIHAKQRCAEGDIQTKTKAKQAGGNL